MTQPPPSPDPLPDRSQDNSPDRAAGKAPLAPADSPASDSPAYDSPAYDNQTRRTQPLGLVIHTLGMVSQYAFAFIIALFAMRDNLDRLIFLVPLVLFASCASFFMAWLGWYRTSFEIGTEDVRKASGIFSRTARSIPYDRIQDVAIEQSFLARLLGLVSVKIETGAGGKDDISLAYLTQDEGRQLREVIRKRKAEAQGTHTGPADAAALARGEASDDSASDDRGSLAQSPQAQQQQPQTLFAMDAQRLTTFSTFEFSLIAVGILIGFAQQFDFLLPFELGDIEAWQALFSQSSERLSALSAGVQTIAAILSVLSVLVVGFGTGFGRTFLRDWGFILQLTEQGFRRRRGLFTRTDVVMPVHRVQALKLSTKIIRRKFGWYGLKFVSLAQDAGASNHDAAPFAKQEECWPIAKIAGFDPPGDDLIWYRASRNYLIHRLITVWILPVIVALIAALAGYPSMALGVGAIGLALCLIRVKQWQNMQAALGNAQVFLRRGWLRSTLMVAPQIKLQSIDFAQGPLGRLGGYGTVHLGLAGGKLAMKGLPVEQAMQIRAPLLAQMAQVDFSKLNQPT